MFNHWNFCRHVLHPRTTQTLAWYKTLTIPSNVLLHLRNLSSSVQLCAQISPVVNVLSNIQHVSKIIHLNIIFFYIYIFYGTYNHSQLHGTDDDDFQLFCYVNSFWAFFSYSNLHKLIIKWSIHNYNST